MYLKIILSGIFMCNSVVHAQHVERREFVYGKSEYYFRKAIHAVAFFPALHSVYYVSTHTCEDDGCSNMIRMSLATLAWGISYWAVKKYAKPEPIPNPSCSMRQFYELIAEMPEVFERLTEIKKNEILRCPYAEIQNRNFTFTLGELEQLFEQQTTYYIATPSYGNLPVGEIENNGKKIRHPLITAFAQQKCNEKYW